MSYQLKGFSVGLFEDWFVGFVEGGGLFIINFKYRLKRGPKKEVIWVLALVQSVKDGFVLEQLKGGWGGTFRFNKKDGVYI